MAKRKLKVSTEKRKAWDAFSLYVRTKECLETTGTPDSGRCITCGAIRPRQLLDAGHFIAGRTNGILYDERGVHIQCKQCNGFREGAREEYYPWMLAHYSEAVVSELCYLRKHPHKMSALDHRAVKEKYQAKLQDLRRQHGIDNG